MKIKDMIGEDFEDNLMELDYSYIKELSRDIQNAHVYGQAEAEELAYRCLVATDKIADYLGIFTKNIYYLENKVNTVRNTYALTYTAPEGRTTGEMRAYAVKSCPEAEEVYAKIAKLKGAKENLELKFDIFTKTHHFYKDILSQYNRSMPFAAKLAHSQNNDEEIDEENEGGDIITGKSNWIK